MSSIDTPFGPLHSLDPARFRGVEMIQELDPLLRATHAGRVQVQQVFLNILMNAAQAIETLAPIFFPHPV